MVHKVRKKSAEWKKLFAVWMETGYDKSVKAFRQTFGYDYEDAESMEKELDLMDADVKKAPLWRLKELVGYLQG